MNRSERRAIRRRLKSQGRAVVTLSGGPMEGWVVAEGAPCLRRDWCATWPPSVAARERPGYYRVRPSEGVAVWVEFA